jgi:hypothetical protein
VVARALQELYSTDSSFDIEVDTLDGTANVLRTIKLKNCLLHSITHPTLDYAGSRHAALASFSAKIPNKVGPLIDRLKEDPVANALLTALEGSHYQLHLGHQEELPGACQFHTHFVYDSIEVIFP